MDRDAINPIPADAAPVPRPAPALLMPSPPVHEAIRSGKLVAIRRALASDPDALQRCDDKGDPPLHFAIRSGAPIALVEFLIQQGAKPDACNMHRDTAVHIACGLTNVDTRLLALLLHHAARNGDGGARIAAFLPDANGRHAYERALDAHRQPRREMESAIAALQRHDGWYRAYLANMAKAVKRADLDGLAALLAFEMPLDLVIDQGKTALMMAAEIGHADVVDMLLVHAREYGLRQLNVAAPSGDTALTLAAFHGHVAVVERLLAESAATEVPSEGGDTALMAAAISGHEGIAERLLKAGAAVDSHNALERTALMFAAVAGHAAVVGLLLRHGAAVDARDAEGRTALAYAALHARAVESGPSISQRIRGLPAGAPVANAKAQPEDASRGSGRYREAVRMLLAHGATVNACDAFGATALMHAARNGHIEILSLLLGAGADGRRRDRLGRMALDYATAAGQRHAARVLSACPA
ncbi:ankyrin repeat domain-containing protein [Cupriavidus respiraculi]|uniref:Ankyrin repeat domain-containing protein n=1 Tax=Cupriavidus respiraculi TaxID=195930 RepID=A0ABN7Z5C9_9BURK|nr:ankyrin repeat domain-containing protein [Cupriavidus respiraculi]CAG9179512.1 hypothetical protein LMG21510_03799 [Cupriavidus respiraculi]